MKKFKRRPYILGAVLFILLIVLVITGKDYFLNFRENYLLGKRSIALLSIEGDKVKMKFDITDKDRLSALEFSRKLGVSENWMEGISLELDEGTKNRLSQILPVELELKFNGQGVEFYSKHNSFISRFKDKTLQSAQSENDFDFATESAKLSLRAQNERDFSLELEDPNPLLRYATESGRIYLSKKVYGMFPITANIARIELEVSGKDVSGEIQLK